MRLTKGKNKIGEIVKKEILFQLTFRRDFSPPQAYITNNRLQDHNYLCTKIHQNWFNKLGVRGGVTNNLTLAFIPREFLGLVAKPGKIIIDHFGPTIFSCLEAYLEAPTGLSG